MLSAKKILLIEDDNLINDFIIDCLDSYDCEIVNTFDNVLDAIDYITHNTVDLILSDITLNGELTGIDFAQQVKLHTKSPIIFISGDINNEAIKSNPYGYLLKPFTCPQLCIAIEIACYRAASEEKLLSYQAHLHQAQVLGNMGSWEWDIITNELQWTDQIYRIFGLLPKQFEPTYPHFLERIHPDDRSAVQDAVDDAIQTGDYDIFHRIITPAGEVRYVREVGDVTYDEHGVALKMVGTVIDITQSTLQEDKLRHLAFHDPLTNLANRALLMDRLEIQLANSKRNNLSFAVLFIDLDKFKSINDQYGHKAGDIVLQVISKRLQNSIRESDTVARFGGDEFVLLITSSNKLQAIKSLAQKIVKSVERTIPIFDDLKVSLSCSIGISIYPDTATTVHELLTQSDDAMYQAKQNDALNISVVSED